MSANTGLNVDPIQSVSSTQETVINSTATTQAAKGDNVLSGYYNRHQTRFSGIDQRTVTIGDNGEGGD